MLKPAIILLSLMSAISLASTKHDGLVKVFMDELESSYSVQCPSSKSLVLNCSENDLDPSALTLLEGRLDCKGVTTHHCYSSTDSSKGIAVKVTIKGRSNKFRLKSIKMKPFNGFVLD